MDRRAFLMGSSMLALSQLTAGCSGQTQGTLRVQLLKNSIPVQLLGRFREELRRSTSGKVDLNFDPEAQLQDVFNRLQAWKRRADAPAQPDSSWFPLPGTGRKQTGTVPDLVTLGDYWLAKAIEQKLIQPLDPTQWQQWQSLSETPLNWKQLVTRNDRGELDRKGQVWAAPYRWGSTVIVYRKDLFAQKGWQPPTDWADLWRPELKGKISLLDQPREVIGLTLKSLGRSYNEAKLDPVPNLKAKLEALQQQVKFYSSTNYLQPLLLGDTWLAVGWSVDVQPQLQRTAKLAAIVPISGTAIWADLWVRPARPATTTATPVATNARSLPDQWIDFCWQPAIAEQLSSLGDAMSPRFAGVKPDQLPRALQANQWLLPSAQILEQSDFLNPLPDRAVNDYAALWNTIRRG